jgi:hypothetical protein
VEKRINLDATNQNPGLIQRFKDTQKGALEPTPVQDIADATDTDLPDFDALLAQLQACKLGTTDATKYERAVEALLNALFYPDLVTPSGRKRFMTEESGLISHTQMQLRRASSGGWAITTRPQT